MKESTGVVGAAWVRQLDVVCCSAGRPLPVMGALITFGRFGVPLVAGLVEAWNEYWTYSDWR